MWWGITISGFTGFDLYGAKKLLSAPARCHPCTISDFPSPVFPSSCTSQGPVLLGGFGGFSAWRIIMILLGGGDPAIGLSPFGAVRSASRTLYSRNRSPSATFCVEVRAAMPLQALPPAPEASAPALPRPQSASPAASWNRAECLREIPRPACPRSPPS